MRRNEIRSGPRVLHLDDPDAKSLFELADARLVAIRKGAGTAPGRGDDSNAVARLQMPGLFQRTWKAHRGTSIYRWSL